MKIRRERKRERKGRKGSERKRGERGRGRIGERENRGWGSMAGKVVVHG